MRRTLSLMALLFSALMIFFTFFAWGWFSDVDGFKTYFEIPVTTESGSLATFSDVIWMLAPFFLLIGVVLFFSRKKFFRTAALFLSSVPLSLYAVCRILLFLGEKEGHFSILVTLFFLLVLGALTAFSAFFPELQRFAGQLALIHVGVEIGLVVLSALFGEKYSQFYFSQLLPMGRYSNFRYSFFLISIFLYYLFFSLSLACLHFSAQREFSASPKKSKTPLEKEEDPPLSEEEDESEEEEDPSPISLEDLGIER